MEKTTEQKAKAYDEALAKAKEQYNYPCMRSCMGILEEIFPELKESDDEKMRKELIRAFKSLNTIKVWNGIERTDILAWLEKQGLKSNPYSGVSFNYNGNTWGMCARDNGVDILFNRKLIQHISDKKQGEQKAYPKALDEAIDLYYFSYGNNKGGFDNLSLEKFRDIVKTFIEDYGK